MQNPHGAADNPPPPPGPPRTHPVQCPPLPWKAVTFVTKGVPRALRRAWPQRSFRDVDFEGRARDGVLPGPPVDLDLVLPLPLHHQRHAVLAAAELAELDRGRSGPIGLHLQRPRAVAQKPPTPMPRQKRGRGAQPACTGTHWSGGRKGVGGGLDRGGGGLRCRGHVCPTRCLCMKYPGSSPVSFLTEGSPRSRSHWTANLPCKARVGGLATSPLPSRGSPIEGDEIRSGYITPAFFGADCLVVVGGGGENRPGWGLLKKRCPAR